MEYRSRLKDDQVDMLFESILCLENQEECYRFFEDLCTINEIKSLAQRWKWRSCCATCTYQLQIRLVPALLPSAESIVP